MIRRITSRLVAGCLLAFAIAAFVGVKLSAQNNPASKARKSHAPSKERLVVHEWGTFTSIAGRDGVSLDWRPLNGPSDLPKFVHTIDDGTEGLRHRQKQGKGDMTARVRMETPVLYFYSGSEMDVSVKVDFPKGRITEWYPQARAVGTNVDWGKLKVMPGAALTFPVESAESHYYPAREVDADPVQVCGTKVALELKGRESIVPAGAICVTQPGKGPGTPYFDDASAKFRSALSRLDFQNGGAQALSIVLSEAREYDSLTLWHLLSRVQGQERGRVYDRLATLIAPPKGVTREGVMRLDKGMLDLWKQDLEWAWFE